MATAVAGEREAFFPSRMCWVPLLEGIAAIIVGILLLSDTERTVFTLVLFAGIWWFISGILGILAGLVVVGHPIWAALLVPTSLVWVVGIIGIIIGVVALIRSFQGVGVAAVTAIYVGAIWAIIGGIGAVVFAFRLRSA